MPSEPVVQPIRLRGPSAVVAVVPYLLGFQPSNSLVLLLSRGESGRVELTLRVDLPAPRHAEAAAAELLEGLRHAVSDRAIAVVYPAESDAGAPNGRHEPFVAALGAALGRSGRRLVDALHVSQDRWWSYLCDDPGCCPPEGHPVHDSDGWEAAAEAVGHGLAAQRSRSAFAAAVVPALPELRAEVEGLLPAVAESVPGREDPGWPGWRAAAEEAVLAAVAGLARPHEFVLTPAATAALLVALSDFRVRDPVLWHLARVNRHGADDPATRLFGRLTGGAPEAWVAPPATLLAICHWQAGNGAAARVALDHIPDGCADYSLARLVTRALDVGLPPGEWVRMLGALELDGCRTGVAA